MEFRGGNSRHTRNMRCMHDAPTDVLTGAYTEEEYFADVLRVTEGQTDESLARLVIRESPHAAAWARSHGVRFQPSLGGTLHLGRTNAFFLGGGKALMNAYYEAASRSGVRVVYNAEVTSLDINSSQDRGPVSGRGGRDRGFACPLHREIVHRRRREASKPISIGSKKPGAKLLKISSFAGRLITKEKSSSSCSIAEPNPSVTPRNATRLPSTPARQNSTAAL